MIDRLLTWLRGLFSSRAAFIRPDTTEAQMAAVRRELRRRLGDDRGDDHG